MVINCAVDIQQPLKIVEFWALEQSRSFRSPSVAHWIEQRLLLFADHSPPNFGYLVGQHELLQPLFLPSRLMVTRDDIDGTKIARDPAEVQPSPTIVFPIMLQIDK